MATMNIGWYETENGSGLETGHAYERERERESERDEVRELER